MRVLPLLLLTLVAGAFALCPSALPAAVQAIINQTQWTRSYFGIHAIYQNSTGGWTNLVDVNGNKFFTPASNNKLLTTSAFFTKQGAGFKWETPVFNTTSGVCISGRGDPSVTSANLAALAAELSVRFATLALVLTPIQPFVVGGQIHVQLDDSFYEGEAFPTQWEWEDLSADYGAQPTSFAVNENVVTIVVTPGISVGAAPAIAYVSPSDKYGVSLMNMAVTSASKTQQTLSFDWELGSLSVFLEGTIPLGSAPITIDVAVPDTTGYFGNLLSYYVKQQVGAQLSFTRGPCANGPIFTSLVSGDLSVTMNWTLQMSDNLYAESYQRYLGTEFMPSVGDATLAGIAFVEAQLGALHMDVTAFSQQDGSGVARSNLLTPQLLAQVLVMMDALPDNQGEVYRDFLPLAGETGTLQTRFIGTPAQGVVQAKTGTLMGVSALSGYLIHQQFPKVIFSVLINHSDQSTTARQTEASANENRQNAIDSIVVLLAQLVPCS